MSEIITCQKCNQKLRIPTDRENIEITCPSCKTIQNLSSNTMNDDLSAIKDKATLEKILSRIRATKVNVLLIGATGSGKSSTISALFENYGNGRKSSAKVGHPDQKPWMSAPTKWIIWLFGIHQVLAIAQNKTRNINKKLLSFCAGRMKMVNP